MYVTYHATTQASHEYHVTYHAITQASHEYHVTYHTATTQASHEYHVTYQKNGSFEGVPTANSGMVHQFINQPLKVVWS